MYFIFFHSEKNFQKFTLQDMLFYQFYLTVFLLTIFESLNCEVGLHTNEFAVHVHGGNEIANEIAEKYGFVNRGQIGSLKDYYLFEHHEVEKRSISPSSHHSELLQSDSSVLWFEQQKVKRRVKRNTLKNEFPGFHDPLYSEQWFLHGGGYGGYDMNVIPAWKEGFTGKGVVVSILDDGIQGNHPDLAQNYDKDASWDINDSDDDPTPQDDDDNKHGTRCAGEVAAVAYNEFCGVGIAYNASIGGVRMLDGSVTDRIEATALSLKPNHIHIYSASWGPEDDGKTVEGPGKLAKAAFEDGINKGRGGLGSIFVWASGNGGRHSDSCNCDGYTNSIYTISVSSATQSGLMPWYLEQCSSTLATTYSSGASSQDQNIVTVDVDYSYFNDFRRGRKPNTSNLCTRSHTGTSASAPIAAAICALALEANPKLTWRDMQYLIVLTSRYEPLSKEDGWVTNAVGRKISTKFGYGLMDAVAMVKLAKTWKTLPKQHICYSLPDTIERIIPAGHGEKLEASMNTSCKNSENPVVFLEHVQVKITLTFHPRGNLRIILISPSGTPSAILLPRPRDKQDGSFRDWPFMSVHFWGENPEGNWKLVIINDGNLITNIPGKLTNWSLVFYGTEEMPLSLSHLKEPEMLFDTSKQEHVHLIRGVDQFTEFISNLCSNDKKFLITVDGEKDCTNKCPVGYYSDHKYYICRKCDKSCLSCSGPSYNNCLSCPNGFFHDNLRYQCLPCISSCETCHVSRELCETCKPGLLLYQQKCWSACPVGTYKEQNVCKKCHEACESCYGPLHFNCLSCSGYFLFNGTCQRKCPSRFYANSDYKCYRCHRSCETCSDNNTCTECPFTWEFDASNKCVLNSVCKIGWYNQDSKSCDVCYPHCQQCIGPRIQDCIYCEAKYLWLEGQCVRSCPDGFFAKNGACTPCNEMCSKCKNERNNCVACKHDLLLYHGSCVASCPSGYFNNGKGKCEVCDSTCLLCTGGSNMNCTTCPMGLYLVYNGCQTKCPDGFFPVVNEDYSECLPCHYTCKTCTDYGPTYCVSCYDNASYINGMCLPCSDGEFYNRITKECQKCDDKCSQCFGPFENTCLSCPTPLRLDEVKHTCLPCCDASSVGSECCTCSQDLGVCVTSDHPRSIDVSFTEYDSEEIIIPLKHLVPIVVTICISVVLLFALVFGILQAYSIGFFRFNIKGKRYELVPNHNTAKFEAEMEKISLTQDDLEDEDEIYEKV